MCPVLALISQQCFGNPYTVCIHSVICLPVSGHSECFKVVLLAGKRLRLFSIDLFMCAFG